jgi:hypothetical protein
MGRKDHGFLRLLFGVLAPERLGEAGRDGRADEGDSSFKGIEV